MLKDKKQMQIFETNNMIAFPIINGEVNPNIKIDLKEVKHIKSNLLEKRLDSIVKHNIKMFLEEYGQIYRK